MGEGNGMGEERRESFEGRGGVRGVNTNKCESINKMTTITARMMFISKDF